MKSLLKKMCVPLPGGQMARGGFLSFQEKLTDNMTLHWIMRINSLITMKNKSSKKIDYLESYEHIRMFDYLLTKLTTLCIT